MADAMFEKFNEMFDLNGLREDVENSGGDFKEVPHDDYEVSIAKIEMGVTGERSKTPGMPQAKVWFKVLNGEYRGQLIFMNQNLTTGFGIHQMNDFLDSLESGIPVEFVDFVQYAQLFDDVFNAVKDSEYQLAYGENSKGFNTYNIVQKFH